MINIFWGLAAVQFNLGGFRVEGFADGDAVTIVPEADSTTARPGGDGSHNVFSRMNNRLHTMTINLDRGTKGYKQLMDAFDAQIEEFDDGTSISALEMSILNPFTGEKVTDAQVVFRRLPDSNWATEAPQATITAWLSDPQRTNAPNVSIT